MAKRLFSAALVGCAALALAACNGSKNGGVAGSGTLDDAEKASETLLKTGGNGDDWAGIGYSYDEQRFSPLTDINDKNVGGLGIAWFADLEDARGQEATPVVVDGVMYVSHAWSKVDAWDAATGKQLWSFDPKVPGDRAVDACCDVVNRGVAVWGDKLFVGNEARGLPQDYEQACDMLVKIPMLGKTESLNASVAAGIVFYEGVRQLQSKGLLKSG